MANIQIECPMCGFQVDIEEEYCPECGEIVKKEKEIYS